MCVISNLSSLPSCSATAGFPFWAGAGPSYCPLPFWPESLPLPFSCAPALVHFWPATAATPRPFAGRFFARRSFASWLRDLELSVKTHTGKCAPLCMRPPTSHSSFSISFCFKRRYGQYTVFLYLSSFASSSRVVVASRRSHMRAFKSFTRSLSFFEIQW